MEEELKKRGAPIGNQNARKHGFYSHVLDEEESRDYEIAVEVEGIDEEIALLRVKIKSLVTNYPENVKLIAQALHALERLVRTKYDIAREDKKTTSSAIATVLKDIALPIGVGIGNALRHK